MSLSTRLASALNIRAGEGRTVTLLLVHSLFVGVVQLFSARAAEPLFLVTFGAHNLPYLYITSAIATTAAGAVYTRVAERLSFATALVLNLVVLLLGTCCLRLLLWLPDARWPVMALAIWVSVQYVLINVAFWGLAGCLLNLRQSKRLFGLIGSAEVVATIGCGLLTPALVSQIGTPNLLWIAAGGIAGALMCVIGLARNTDALAMPSQDDATASPAGYRGLLRHRYILLIVAFTSLSWLGWYVVDNLFFEQAASRYTDENQLAGFLGVFGAVAGSLTLVSRTVVTAPLINRYGLVTGLLACPLLVGAGAALVALSGTLLGPGGTLVYWLALLTKLLSDVLEASIYQSSFLLLYQPLAAGLRLQVQTAVETLVEPAAVAGAGVVLLLLIGLLGFGTIGLAYVAAAILLGMCAVGVMLGRAYPAALLQALTGRKLGGRTLSLSDRSTVAVLHQALRGGHAGTVLYALDLLESIEHASLATSLQNLLAHPSATVRQDVLLRIERHSLSMTLPAVRRRVEHETSAPVRGAMVRVLAALGDVEVVAEAKRYLNDPEPWIKRGALTGLLRSGDSAGGPQAEAKLLELAQAPVPDDRALAATALGDAGIASLYHPLLPLLRDDVPRVRAAALEAAGRLNNPRLWPLVVEALAEPTFRAAASAALVAGGDAVVPRLREVFRQPSQPRQLLIRIARICGRVRGTEAVALLREHMAFGDPEVRGQVLAALSRSGYRAGADSVGQVHSRINAEVADAAPIVAALADIGDGPEIALVQAALDYQLQQCRARLLLLLSFILEPQAIQRISDNLAHAVAAKRAYALELLELLAAQELKAGLLALFDDLTPAQRLQRLSGAYPQPRLDRAARLGDLISTAGVRQAWIKACALYILSRIASPTLEPALAAALSAPAALVRETAQWVENRTQPSYQPGDAAVADAGERDSSGRAGGRMSLSTIERVLILKRVSIFAATPDEVLVDVAAVLEELDLPAGRTIFEKGDAGTCMYMIVDGRVRVYDGARTLDILGTGDVFGEMAVLDAAPRVAAAATLDAARLFRLDQDALYEVMADRVEVVRGIIGVLSQRLRARMHDVAVLSARVQELSEQRIDPRIDANKT